MQKKYFDEITDLLRLTHPGLAATNQLEFKYFFGAVAGYIDNHIFISCGKFGLALKLPYEVLEDLFKDSDVKHLQYFPKGHIKKTMQYYQNE